MIINDEKDENVCGECGQSLQYKSAVSRGTVAMLKAISAMVDRKGINVVHIQKELVKEGALTPNQAQNITHCVRLGLVAHVEDAGNYCLTTKAMNFLNGEDIPKYAYVKKRTAEQGAHTEGSSEEMCNAKDFIKKGSYWEVPGFEIREGHVVRGNSRLIEV